MDTLGMEQASEQQQAPEWADGLQRLVVASAIYTDLLTQLPGAFTPELFGRAQSPRQRIAKAIAKYWEQYRARPTEEIVDQLVRAEAEKLPEAQRGALMQEWSYTMDTEVPADPAFIYNELRTWIEYRKLEQGLISAATALAKGPAAILEARAVLDKIAPTSAAAPGAVAINLGNVAPESIEWLWVGRIPLGNVTIFIGDPGLGKSKLTLDVASRHSRGSRWADGTSAPLGRTVLLTSEDNIANTVRPRVDAMGGDAKQITILQAIRGDDKERPFDLQSDLPALERLINNVDANLVIIDPLSAYLGKGVDSHNDAELRRVLGPLAALAERTRTAVVCVMHLNKDQQKKALYRGQGSIAFMAAARSVLGVVEDKNNPDRRLFVPIKSNLSKKSATLAFTHSGQGLYVGGQG